MKIIQVKWTSSTGYSRTVVRAIIQPSNDWIEGWIAGVTEMVGLVKGEINNVSIHEDGPPK